MKIAVRLDDISQDMNWKNFFRMKKLLDSKGIKPLIGVIPNNKDPKLIDFKNSTYEECKDEIPSDFWEYVRELKRLGWSIAMHGVYHEYKTNSGGIFPLNQYSEFASLGYEEQEAMLMKGKLEFDKHEIDTDIFMAPAHSFDLNTLKALKKIGISRITDGFGKYPYKYKNMTFYPISFDRKSVLKAKDKDGYTTFVYHTNTMNDKDFENLSKQLSEFEFISFDEYLNCQPVVAGEVLHLKEYLMAIGKRILVNLKK